MGAPRICVWMVQKQRDDEYMQEYLLVVKNKSIKSQGKGCTLIKKIPRKFCCVWKYMIVSFSYRKTTKIIVYRKSLNCGIKLANEIQFFLFCGLCYLSYKPLIW